MNILIIDDEEAIVWSLRRAFERAGHRVAVAAAAEDGLFKLDAHNPDVIFLDIHLPGMTGLQALAKFKERVPHCAVIIITAHGSLDTAVQAVAGGAFDYLPKPFELAQALSAASRAIERSKSREESSLPEPTIGRDELIGKSPAMQVVFRRIALVAPTEACVLITGESGTGKELAARAVHANSLRRDKPFLPVHVAAMNPNLVESELFGHVKGSFTGADRARQGLLAIASGGTIFLDELADIPLPVQAKLLRVIERQEVLPVGGTQPVKVDVRIVSATHADLAAAVRDEKFRHDLLFRLNVYPIHLPPLRTRSDDIVVLTKHFLRQIGRLDPEHILSEETIDFLKMQSWPGNIRELRNALEHAAIESRGGPLRPEHFPNSTNTVPGLFSKRLQLEVAEWLREQLLEDPEPTNLYQQLLDTVEPVLLDEVMKVLRGNRVATARYLGLARATLRKMLRKYHPSALESDGDNGE